MHRLQAEYRKQRLTALNTTTVRETSNLWQSMVHIVYEWSANHALMPFIPSKVECRGLLLIVVAIMLTIATCILVTDLIAMLPGSSAWSQL